MKGSILSDFGKLVDNKELMLVHIKLNKGETIPAHKHSNQDVYFTLIKGDVIVTLDENETHNLHEGSVLNFDGNYSIGVNANEPSEFFVYLINKI